MAGTANAGFNCPEGDIVTGANNQQYCVSRITMNWYTAFTWCDSFGMSLQSVAQLCDNGDAKWDGNVGSEKCLNMLNGRLTGTVWTANARMNSEAFLVDTSGKVFNFLKVFYGDDRGANRAVCR